MIDPITKANCLKDQSLAKLFNEVNEEHNDRSRKESMQVIQSEILSLKLAKCLIAMASMEAVENKADSQWLVNSAELILYQHYLQCGERYPDPKPGELLTAPSLKKDR